MTRTSAPCWLSKGPVNAGGRLGGGLLRAARAAPLPRVDGEARAGDGQVDGRAWSATGCESRGRWVNRDTVGCGGSGAVGRWTAAPPDFGERSGRQEQ